jgi:hypothetical protein
MTNPKQNQGRGPYGDTKPNQSQLLITEAEIRDIKATIDPKDREWTDLGGDLEGSYDGAKYVDIKIKGSDTIRLFISGDALEKALELMPPKSFCTECRDLWNKAPSRRSPSHLEEAGAREPQGPSPDSYKQRLMCKDCGSTWTKYRDAEVGFKGTYVHPVRS